MSLGRMVMSSYVEIILLPYLMKLPVIFFTSVDGMIIPLPNMDVLSHGENVLMYRSRLLSYGDISMMVGSFVSAEWKINIQDGEINTKANLMISMGKCIAIPYERTGSFPDTLFMPSDNITSAHGEIRKKYVCRVVYLVLHARNISASCRHNASTLSYFRNRHNLLSV